MIIFPENPRKSVKSVSKCVALAFVLTPVFLFGTPHISSVFNNNEKFTNNTKMVKSCDTTGPNKT